jgi:hypothetical protein
MEQTSMGLIARISRGLGGKKQKAAVAGETASRGRAEVSAGPASGGAGAGGKGVGTAVSRAAGGASSNGERPRGVAEAKPDAAEAAGRPAGAAAAAGGDDQATRLRAAMGSADGRSSSEPETSEAPEVATATATDVASGDGPGVSGFDLDDGDDREGGRGGRMMVTGGDGERVAVPQTKKELFEELQKNYREVVMLVRKVDAHLDEQAHRGERLMAIAERLDQSLPLLERMAETPGKLDAIKDELAKLSTSSSEAADKRAARLEQAIGKVVDGVDMQHKDQHKLVSVMAEFRETIGDLNKTNADSGDALRHLGESVKRRDDAMLSRMKTIQLWMAAGLGVIALVAVAALAIVLLR